jgi:hypothetical protein
MISDELPSTTTIDEGAEDLEAALLTSCREIVGGFASLGADLATLPRTPDPLWRSSISRHVDTAKVRHDTELERANEERIVRLVEELSGEYRDVAEPALVDAEVRSEFERLSRESKVEDFVPVLTERTVRDHLNDRFRCHARGRAGTPPDRIAELQNGPRSARHP